MMDVNAPDKDPLTLEDEFEFCVHSQDEDEEEFESAGTRKKSMLSRSSLEHFVVEEFTKKYPGCFSMEYPTDIFEGLQHTVHNHAFSSASAYTKDTLHSSPRSSFSSEQKQDNMLESVPSLHHAHLPYDGLKTLDKGKNVSLLHSPQKSCEKQEENPTLSTVHEGTSKQSMSCPFTETFDTLDSQHNMCHSNEGSFVQELSFNVTVSDTKHNPDCHYEAVKENILNASEISIISNTPALGSGCFQENCRPKTPEEMNYQKLCHRLRNKVFKKKVSPRKLCENHLQTMKKKSSKSLTQNIHASQTSPSHDRSMEFAAQQTPKQTSTPYNEVTPALHHELGRQRSTPVLSHLCSVSQSPDTSCTKVTPSTDSDWYVAWNNDSMQEEKKINSTWSVSDFSCDEMWKGESSINSGTFSTSLFGTLKRQPADKKSSCLGWRKAPRRSLDWPPPSNTSPKTSQQPSKYLNVSPHSWRAAHGNSVAWPQSQPLSKLFHSKVKADFNVKELEVTCYAVGFIDTHCHLDFLLERTRNSGSYSKFRGDTKDPFPVSYKGCVTIFCRPWTFGKITWWERIIAEPEVWAAFGCHPHFADKYGEEEETYLQAALLNSKTVALGEIGLDYNRKSLSQLRTQKEVFRRQLKIALDMKKPVIIHCRDAHKDCIDIIKEILPLNYRIHLHCFTGTWRQAEEWLETFSGLFLGITNLINNHGDLRTHELQMAVKQIPLHRLLLETDAPYFRPAFLQEAGLHSHPGMALYVAAQVAHLKGEKLQVVLAHVRHNTKVMYGI